jgi:hypothetical protein
MDKWVVVDWIYLTRDRGQWPAAVKTLMNLRVMLMAGSFLTRWVTYLATKYIMSDIKTRLWSTVLELLLLLKNAKPAA